MEKKIYTRIDNRLVMEMQNPDATKILGASPSGSDYEVLDELREMYENRPSYPINPSDEHLFKVGERYELGKDFEVKDGDVVREYYPNGDYTGVKSISLTAFAIPKDNDRSKESGWKKLFEFLAEHGGSIVSSNDLSPDWIEQARASGRMWVDENSLGYIWEPDIKLLPTTEKEVEEFDRWYPLPIKLPKELDDPELFFANMKKRELEEKQKKQN